MTEFLNTLDKLTLTKLYKEFGNKENERKKYATNKASTLAEWLVEEGNVTLEDIKSFLDNQSKESPEVVSAPANSIQAMLESGDIDTNKIKQKQSNSDKNAVLAFKKKMELKAMEKVVITITPAHATTLDNEKQCETFMFANQFFSCGRVVPYNVPVEVPRCILNVIKEQQVPVYFDVSKQPQSSSIKMMTKVAMQPRFNVVELDRDTIQGQDIVIASN